MWTSDDAEAARQQANETARPWGANGLTPETVWCKRQAIEPAERQAFAATLAGHEKEARSEQGSPGGDSFDGTLTAAQRREAVVTTLCGQRILEFTTERCSGRLRVAGRKPGKADEAQGVSRTESGPGR